MSTENFAPLLAALQSVVTADDQVTPAEADWMEAVAREVGVTVPASHQLDAEQLRDSLPSEEDRHDFVRLMLMVSLADGSTDARELDIITKLASVLDVPSEKVEELRQETVLAADPS